MRVTEDAARTRRNWLGFAGLAAYLAALVAFDLADDSLPLPRALGFGDLDNYFYPGIEYLHRSIRAGTLPLWNPHAMAGTPFAALHQPGALYPPLLLLAALPPPLAVSLDTLLHLLIGGGGVLLLGRWLGLGALPSLIAAIAFVSAPRIVSGIFNTAHLSTMVWLPAAFLAMHRCVERPDARSAAGLAIVMSLCFLGGFAQGFLYIVQAMGLYLALALARRDSWGARGHSLAVIAAAACLCGALVAPALLPILEHASSATRDLGGVSPRQARVYPPLELSWFGWLGLEATARPARWIAVGLALPIAFMNRSTRREAVALALLGGIALDFMRGENGVAYPIHRALPLGDLFRLPQRIGFVLDFATALLLGLGAQAALTRFAGAGRYRRLVGGAPVVIALVLAGESLARNPPYRFTPLASPELMRPAPGLRGLAALAGHDRLFVVGGPSKFGTLHGTYSLPDYEPLLPGSYAALFGAPPDAIWFGHLGVLPGGRPRDAWTRQSPRLLDLLSVRYYLDLRPPMARRPNLGRVVGAKPVAGGLGAFERASALPRAFVVHELRSVATAAEALALVRGGAFDPHREAIVTDATLRLEPAMPRADEPATLIRYEPHHVEVAVRCASRCLLVLTDLYDADWSVAVNGREGELLAVNYLLRGVVLDPPRDGGEIRVVFRYAPRSFRIGLALAGAGGVALLIAWGVSRRSPRSPDSVQ